MEEALRIIFGLSDAKKLVDDRNLLMLVDDGTLCTTTVTENPSLMEDGIYPVKYGFKPIQYGMKIN